MLVPLLTLILSSLLPLGIALATPFTADPHLVAIAAATLRRALATRAIAGSPSSVSPLPLSLGMFLARAIVDPHIILLSLLSPWLVLAFVPFLALILSPSLLPPWTLLARATCSCKNWVLGPKATPPFIHVQSANFTNNIHIKLRTLNLRGDFWKSGFSCSSHC